MAGLTDLPGDLPAPEDDGAADHLTGMAIPPVKLAASDGTHVELASLSGTTVLYVYPGHRVRNRNAREVNSSRARRSID